MQALPRFFDGILSPRRGSDPRDGFLQSGEVEKWSNRPVRQEKVLSQASHFTGAPGTSARTTTGDDRVTRAAGSLVRPRVKIACAVPIASAQPAEAESPPSSLRAASASFRGVSRVPCGNASPRVGRGARPRFKLLKRCSPLRRAVESSIAGRCQQRPRARGSGVCARGASGGASPRRLAVGRGRTLQTRCPSCVARPLACTRSMGTGLGAPAAWLTHPLRGNFAQKQSLTGKSKSRTTLPAIA